MKYDPWILSGRCNDGNVAFAVMRDQRYATRHHLWSLRSNRRSPVLYRAFLNGHADAATGKAFEEELIGGRRILVERGIETKQNKEFMKRLKEGKNPF